MTVAFLIIKAHSQRVPDKNFRPLAGRPLFRWIVDALLATPAVARVVIDTDCAQRLRAVGLPDDDRLALLDRHPSLLGDHVTANRLIEGSLPHLGTGAILMTHATSPFLQPETLGRAIARFQASNADSLFGVTRHQARFWRSDGRAVNHDPADLVPTQQLEPWFEENSSLYLFTAASFRATGARIGRAPELFETPALESIDIDTEDDWVLAEAVAGGLTRGLD